ncbi:hypothetical protein I4U23_003212 [Adineta vaga]|nr:hypothetical protein I4U23_003212 [Adineta vaga]
MSYHVIHHPTHSNPNNSSNQTNISLPTSQFMPRYHYSRIVPNTTEVFLTENPSNGHSIKPPPPSSSTTVLTTTSNNIPGSFTSTFIPFVSNNRTVTPTMREFIQIPVNREDGIIIQPNNLSRSVPITYIAETNTLPNLENNTNNNIQSTFTNLLRPSSRYFQHHFINNNNNSDEPTIVATSASRVPSSTRRLSLSVPVVTSTNNTDNDTTHTRVLASPVRQIPIRFPQTTVVASTPTTSSRISSAILRSSPFSHSLQRRRTDLGDISSITVNNSSQPSSDFNMNSSTILPIRRAEAMAREAIQNITQQQQQRNSLLNETTNRTSPPPSRRVIINLKNNQSVLLDNHQSASMKLPPLPISPRSTLRNNIYHIPVLHELQMPPHPSAIITEPSFQSSAVNNGSYKNELRMEIPVTITTSNDQENEIRLNSMKEEGLGNNERSRLTNNTNQALKSILKRSSSRETVSRKNVSFMNA